MLKLAMQGKLYYAPITSPSRILDLGTGTGIWCMDMADEFPNAEVLGNDLSPIQPRWIPPNLTFEVDDIESPWTFSRKFDFIHCRGLGNAVHDWPRLMRQTFEATAPGGCAEFVDYDVAWRTPDNSLKEGSPVHQLITTFIKTTRENGQEPSPGPLLEGWMADAGFKDIKVTKMPMPIGTWAADRKMVSL
jgi:trans-aconitate methyltransferase